jgi:hypothetical protein
LDWDDPDTDLVEGVWPVWNPFGRAKTTTGAPPDTAFTPNVWCVEGLLLLKIVSAGQTEFHWLPMTEFNAAFFSGQVHRGVYPVRTSLVSGSANTPLVRPEIPEAIRETNLKPAAVVEPKELTIKVGEAFTLDGSKSHDPEGQPLIYRWHVRGPGGVEPRLSEEPVYKGTGPKKPVEFRIVFYVIDGLRASEAVTVKVKVVDPEAEGNGESEEG